MSTKVCSKCHTTKPITEFNRLNSTTYRGVCKVCRNLRERGYERHRGKTRRGPRLTDRQVAISTIRSMYQYNSKQRGHPWELTDSDVESLIFRPCEYCGSPPPVRRPTGYRDRRICYSGIDRIDSAIGYRPDNCVPCCKTCNYAKQSLTGQEFRAWITRAHNHLQGETMPRTPKSTDPPTPLNVMVPASKRMALVEWAEENGLSLNKSVAAAIDALINSTGVGGEVGEGREG